jgi:hypothetical protein
MSLLGKIGNTAVIFFVVVTVVAVILGVLQVVWIRSKLNALEPTQMSKEIRVKTDAMLNNSNSNALRVYGLIVNVRGTELVNSEKYRYARELKQMIEPPEAVIPHVCTSGVKGLTLSLKASGILIVRPTFGSSQLADDLIKQLVRYVILANKVFLVQYDPEVNEAIKTRVRTMDIPISKTIQDHEIFVLYPVKSKHHELKTVKGENTANCSVIMAPFMGSISMSSDASDFINLKTELGLKEVKEMPIHAMGYKIL